MELSGELARTLLDLAPDPTVVVDSDGIVVFVNAQVEHAFGYSAGELIGNTVESLLPDRFRVGHPSHRQRFASHARPRPMGAGGTLYGRHKNGSEFPVEISLSPIATEQGLLVVAAVRDATSRRAKEVQLVEANRQKTQFLAAASHDLRQPLQALNLLNRAIKSQVGKDSATLGLVERQQLALDSMSALLASVLDISKLDSGGIVAAPTPCVVDDVLARLRSDFEPQATDKGLELRVETSMEGVHTDPELLRRLLANLVANAIRYTQRGSVTVAVKRRDDAVAIEVGDTGLGIPADQLSRVFEEFYQVDRGTQRPEGLGLGLSIVRRLQQLLDCDVQVESAVGIGTTFRVLVPHVEMPPLPRAEAATDSALTGGRVLVIDDERPIAEATSLLLELEGFEVAVASSEREALERTQSFHPDVILSDFHLRGGETGANVVAAVRAGLRQQIPVIFVTGDTARSALAALRMEKAVLMNKPVGADELLRAVRAGVDAHRTQSTRSAAAGSPGPKSTLLAAS